MLKGLFPFSGLSWRKVQHDTGGMGPNRNRPGPARYSLLLPQLIHSSPSLSVRLVCYLCRPPIIIFRCLYYPMEWIHATNRLLFVSIVVKSKSSAHNLPSLQKKKVSQAVSLRFEQSIAFCSRQQREWRFSKRRCYSALINFPGQFFSYHLQIMLNSNLV